MRLPVIIAAVLVAAGGLAGCFGSEEEPTTPASTGNGNGLGAGLAGTLTLYAPLRTTLATSAPAWIQSGTAIDVQASAKLPSKVEGNLSYLWAVGPLPGTAEVEAQKLDTGSSSADAYIQPGASKELVFKVAGNYLMHCHPHPKMLQNVTVVEGFKGPSEVHVQIVDGETPSQSAFFPARIVVAPGTKVIYHNNGTQPHTATLMTQEPALKLADLSAAEGQVTVEGEGWQRVVVIAQGGEGLAGYAEHPIYVTSEMPAFAKQTHTFSFTAGGVSGVASAPEEAEPAQTANVNLAHGGKVFLNWTGTDATGQLADFEIHFTKQGETQDSITGSGASGAGTSTIPGGVYVLSVQATGGVEPEVTVTVEVLYDLVPPAPAAPADKAGGDGHGGHAH